MSLQGPMLIVAEQSATELNDALRANEAFPVVEARWSEAAAALGSIAPAAVLLADLSPRPADIAALRQALAAHRGPYLPVLAQAAPEAGHFPSGTLLVPPQGGIERLIARLRAALRVRSLHASVLRRLDGVVSADLAALLADDPLHDATVLMTGRGRSYPAMAVAVGERMSLIGALSVETAARYLKGRDIDAVVIGEGFGPRIIEALLTVLADDLNFRDMPVVLCGSSPGLADPYVARLPHLDQIPATPAHLVEHLVPMARQHALEARLKRILASLETEGTIDPATGLLAHGAFWRDLDRAVSDAMDRGVGLSIARFAFGPAAAPRVIADAARIVSRLVRNVDFACREDDSIVAVFTETDLRAAHVIARRIASVLKHTMLMPEQPRGGYDPSVTLATLKSSDTPDTLLARITADPSRAAG